MIIINKIIWEPSSTIFSIGSFGIHYYSLMFIIAFLFGFNIMKRMYVKENVATERLETMLFYIVLSTLIGARLGHVIFYDWEYYQSHLLEIFLPLRIDLKSSFLERLTIFFFIKRLLIFFFLLPVFFLILFFHP